MIYKIIGLILITPLLTVLLDVWMKRQQEGNFLIACFFTVLILEAFVIGVYFLFK